MSDEAPYLNSVASAGRAASGGVPSQAQRVDEFASRAVDADRTPLRVLDRLLDGNRRFCSGAVRHGYDIRTARSRAEQPRPVALVIGCIDARVPPEAVFDQAIGDLLVVRTAGHVLDRAALGSVHLAVTKMRVPLIVVLGHEACAAVEYAVAATHRGELPGGDLGYLVEQISPSVLENETDATARAHVASVVDRLRNLPAVADAIAAGELGVAGLRYGVKSGRVEILVPPS